MIFSTNQFNQIQGILKLIYKIQQRIPSLGPKTYLVTTFDFKILTNNDFGYNHGVAQKAAAFHGRDSYWAIGLLWYTVILITSQIVDIVFV